MCVHVTGVRRLQCVAPGGRVVGPSGLDGHRKQGQPFSLNPTTLLVLSPSPALLMLEGIITTHSDDL